MSAALAPALTTLGGAAASAFAKKSNGYSNALDPYTDTRNKYLSWLNSEIGASGDKSVAGMSDQEKESLGYLNDYAKSGLGKTFGEGTRMISDTLNNKYDPTTSSYYQAVKAEAARNAADVNKQIASNAAGAGRYYSGARMKEQREAATDTTNALNKTLGELALQERKNQISLIPSALSAGQTEQNQNLQKAEALQSLGSLPRMIEQSKLDYPFKIAQLASGTANITPTYVENEPKWWQNMLGSLGNMGGQVGLQQILSMIK